MKLLTVGCSFTGLPNSWPDRLQELGHQVTNLGWPAAGNKYISDATISEIVLKNNDYDCVLVMWTGICRLDFVVDSAVIDMYPVYQHRAKKITENFGFATAGGTLDHSHPAITRIKKETLLVINDEARAYQSLLEMIKLQSFLKCSNISYKFMSYVNYWNDEKTLINNNFGIKQFDSLTALSKHIDFSNFIFLNDNNDGIYEMCLTNSRALLESDNFHPTKSGSAAWGDFVNAKLTEGK